MGAEGGEAALEEGRGGWGAEAGPRGTEVTTAVSSELVASEAILVVKGTRERNEGSGSGRARFWT